MVSTIVQQFIENNEYHCERNAGNDDCATRSTALLRRMEENFGQRAKCFFIAIDTVEITKHSHCRYQDFPPLFFIPMEGFFYLHLSLSFSRLVYSPYFL